MRILPTFSDKKRDELLASIPSQLLYPQLGGELEREHLAYIREIFDTLHIHDSRDIDDEELGQAFVAEVVAQFDEETIRYLIERSDQEETIDFKQLVPSESNVPFFTATDALSNRLLSFFPEDKKVKDPFVVASPLVISMLQCHKESTYAPALEGAFKGPGCSALVGGIDRVKVYSYLFTLSGNNNVEMIAGYKNENDVPVYKTFRIKNLTFS